jgi:hypothetical protein
MFIWLFGILKNTKSWSNPKLNSIANIKSYEYFVKKTTVIKNYQLRISLEGGTTWQSFKTFQNHHGIASLCSQRRND